VPSFRGRGCSAIARDRGVVDRRHVCVKATSACPAPPPGFRLNCEAVVATCGGCGKTVCPARD
jgi:flavoprotein